MCVLEVSDRFGGRIYIGKVGNNLVEFGVLWIYGIVGNFIFDFVCDLKYL